MGCTGRIPFRRFPAVAGPLVLSLTLLLTLFAATGCSGVSATSAPDVRTETAWKVTLTSFETAEDLSGTQTAQHYDGTSTTSDLAKKPAEGKTFLLVTLVVEKMKPGTAAFRWEDVRVEDAQGNAYARLANDTFLESFGYHRIKSTDLTLGRNEGTACFEIPKTAASGPLVLVHTGADGETRMTLR